MGKLISVIVPVYNSERFLNQCIESILEQTYRDLEIILINDGSTDRSLEIMEEYAKHDRRIVLLNQRRGGAANARNRGLKAAHGSYLMFVDSDDYISKDMISFLYKRLSENDAQIAACGYELVNEGGSIFPAAEKFPEMGIITENEIWDLYYDSRSTYFSVIWNKIYEKEIFEGIEFIDGKHYEDEYLFDEIMLKAPRITCAAQKKYFYRQWDGSLMGRKDIYYYTDFIEAIMIRLNYLYEKQMFDVANHTFGQAADALLDCCVNESYKTNGKFRKNVDRQEQALRRLAKRYIKQPVSTAFGIKLAAFLAGKRIYCFFRDLHRIKRQKRGNM